MPELWQPINFDAVRKAVPLRQFIGSLGVTLQKDGDCWRAKCPLHNEKHGASLLVYPDGRWYCHGKCAATFPKGGDIVDLAGALWAIEDRCEVVERLLGEAPRITRQARQQTRQSRAHSSEPKWPARDLGQIDAIVRAGFGLYDFWENSPTRFTDGENHAEEIIDAVFPNNPLLCIGRTERLFATQWRETWRGRLADYPLIVANPMLRKVGLTASGKQSQHTLDATAAPIYLPIECDFSRYDNSGKPTVFLPLIDGWQRDSIQIAEACVAILWHLAGRLPLVLGVHSGNKSIHGWYAAFDRRQQELWTFMRHAYSLGADRVTWTPSQFVRLPDGRRQNGARQVTYYLDPTKAIKL